VVVAWQILYSEPFEEWWGGLTEGQQDALTARVELLKERGPNLGRPTSTTSTSPLKD
jgi:hypothetical protein